MGFLICDKCKGYYELQAGESPNDFKSCECGGNLKYIQNFDNHIIDKLESMTEISVCPKCGKQNVNNAKICVFCGKKLNNAKNTSKNINKSKSNDKSVNTKSVIIGFIVTLITGLVLLGISKYLFLSVYIAFLAPIMGGFAAAYTSSSKYKIGILNGIIANLIIGILLLIYGIINGDQLVSASNPDIAYNVGYVASGVLVYTFPPIIIGIIGSLIGTFINKRSNDYEGGYSNKIN